MPSIQNILPPIFTLGTRSESWGSSAAGSQRPSSLRSHLLLALLCYWRAFSLHFSRSSFGCIAHREMSASNSNGSSTLLCRQLWVSATTCFHTSSGTSRLSCSTSRSNRMDRLVSLCGSSVTRSYYLNSLCCSFRSSLTSPSSGTT